MEIAQAQYVRPETPKGQRFQMQVGGDAAENSDAEDGVGMYSEIVDDDFTIESIGQVSTQVNSRITPVTMMEWMCPAILSLFRSSQRGQLTFAQGSTQFELAETLRKADEPQNVIQLALLVGDIDMLTFLLTMGQKYQHGKEEDRQRFYTVGVSDLTYSYKVDNPNLLRVLIKQTGAGIPFNELVKQSGVEISEKPKYYQGLSVHGKKRKDWAAVAGGRRSFEHLQDYPPSVLHAAHLGSLQLTKWFLTESPMRCYNAFAEANTDDKRLQRLAQAHGGFEAAMAQFITSRSHLAIHCCLMGERDDRYPTLRFLVKAMPSAVDARSSEGLTPLHIAMELYDDVAARILVEAGADQTARDKSGNTMLHRLLHRQTNSEEHLEKLPLMLDVIDKRLLSTLFLERSSEHPSSLTPLAKWISNSRRGPASCDTIESETLRIILRYSQGAELSNLNGEGDTPLHVAVREEVYYLVEVILEHDPTLVNRENATGRTPYEMAEDATIAGICSDPPPIAGDHRFNARHSRRTGLPAHWADPVVNRQYKNFHNPPFYDRQTNTEKVWNLVRGTKEKLDAQANGKRRLVTLNEANQVARRLATVKAGSLSRRGGDEEHEQVSVQQDEVQHWLPWAAQRI